VPTLPALCLLAVSLLVAPARLLLRPPSPGSLRTRLGRYVGWTMPLAVSLLCLPLILGGRPLNVVGRQLLSATNPVGCHWNVADAAALSHRLSERGIEGARHAASVLRLPSPEAFFLHFVQTGSDTSVPPRAACGEALAALPSTVPPDELPREWLLRSRWDGTHLYLVPLPAALDWTDTRVGFFEASPPAEELPLQQARIGHVRPLQLSWIAAPTLHADGPIRSVVVRVPVRLPDSGGIRVRALPLCKVPEHTVHVRSAEGLLLDSLRDDEGLLLPGDGGRLSGTVTLEWRMVPGMGEFPRHLLAPLALELPTESNPLDRLLEGFRCP
jgi:hypothetical protein